MIYITGYGLLSCLPEDESERWHSLNHADEYSAKVIDSQTYAPFFCHPLTTYPVDDEIPNHSDRRAMNDDMRAGVYAAGKALSMANLKHNTALLADTDVIVCFSGGGRDDVGDQHILSRGLTNDALVKNIRPTLLLSQLPNLLAANIAIVHHVTGYSLTIMGEEMASAQAIQIACERIAAGLTKRVLVSSVFIGNTTEHMLSFSDVLRADRKQDGICLGSASASLLLESEDSVIARGAIAQAKISDFNITTDISSHLYDNLAVLSSMSGYPGQTTNELSFWAEKNIYLRTPNHLIGTLLGATLPTYFILAMQCLMRGQLFSPAKNNIEKAYPSDQVLQQIGVHCPGHLLGHAFSRLERV